MQTFTGPTWAYICPDDGDLGKNVADLIRLTPANSSVRGMIYGWTDPQTFQAIIEAQNRPVDVRVIYDQSQSLESVENRNLAAFFGQVKLKDSSGAPYFISGTSYVGKQIVHAKTVWVNWSGVAPTTPLPDLQDWRDYVTGGYPVVLRGSYNFSTRARQQVNTQDISPSWELCQMYQETFDKLWKFNIESANPQVPPKKLSFIPDQ